MQNNQEKNENGETKEDESKDSQEKSNDGEKKGTSSGKKKKQQFKTTDLPMESCVPSLSYTELQNLIEKEVMLFARDLVKL